jgi:hypothetical protein
MQMQSGDGLFPYEQKTVCAIDQTIFADRTRITLGGY